jgi:hypothetical protein
MLTLEFDCTSRVTLGPAPSFVLDGEFIRQGPHDRIVCCSDPGGWKVGDEVATGFACSNRTRIQFEDSQGRTSPHYGPFHELCVTEFRCFADRELFAELTRRSQVWCHRSSGVNWRILHILPARAAER